MPRGRPKKNVKASESNVVGDNESAGESGGETDSVQNTADPIELLKRTAGTGTQFIQIDVRRLGDPPIGGYIGRLNFTSPNSLDELPERISENWGGGLYRIQLLKARTGGAMRYSSSCYELAIAGEPLPISRKTEEPAKVEAAPAPVAVPDHYAGYHRAEAPRPQGFSISEMLELAKAMQSGKDDSGIEKAMQMVQLFGGAQAPAQTDPLGQIKQMFGIMELMRNFDRKEDPEPREDDLGSGGLNKLLIAAALKFLGSGSAPSSPAPQQVQPSPAQRPVPARQPGSFGGLPEKPKIPGNWAWVPDAGWVDIDLGGEEEEAEGVEPMQADLFEAKGGSGSVDMENVAAHIRALPEDERQAYITGLTTRIFDLDEKTVTDYIDAQSAKV